MMDYDFFKKRFQLSALSHQPSAIS